MLQSMCCVMGSVGLLREYSHVAYVYLYMFFLLLFGLVCFCIYVCDGGGVQQELQELYDQLQPAGLEILACK